MSTPEQAVMSALLACGLGAVAALVCARHRRAIGWVSFAATALACSLILWAASRVILTGQPGTALTFWTLPKLGFALRIYVDGLSAIFLALIALVALPAALYSIAYLDHYRRYSAGRYYSNFLLFIAGMIGLVTTTDAMFFFFVFWQLMTLTSYLLIRFERDRPENCRAANRYLGMMQLACGLTLIGTELLARTAITAGNETLQKYDFEALSQQLPTLLVSNPGAVATAFALFLAGFGIKAGMWPFGQFWLPEAHPAAPSPISALLSGVMIKTGVYGLMRYFLWLVPFHAQSHYPARQWGALIALLGTLTLLIGTVQALKQEQSKRLLAFHSIGQIGYILLGFGASLLLLPSSDWALVALASLGFYGALFHTLNHGLFKSLLFLNAGSMLCATGTQDLNRMGGLLRWMPLTALTALVGSCSISGVPLFNGFASKWSIYVATLHSAPAVWFLPICGVVAILTSTLTLASFIKFFGASFLSRTSRAVAEQVRRQGRLEVPWTMQLPQVFLASACLLLGVMPMLAYSFIRSSLNASKQGLGTLLAHAVPVETGLWRGLEALPGHALFAPLLLLAVLAGMIGLARMLAHAGGASAKTDAPWLCGYVGETEAARYHAHGFYGELKRYLHWFGGTAHPPPRRHGPGAHTPVEAQPHSPTP